jgi:hypothetical protein
MRKILTGGSKNLRGSLGTESFVYDEKGKIPLGRRGCLPIITGSGFGESRVPQNLEADQRREDHPAATGVGREAQRGNRGLSKGRLVLITEISAPAWLQEVHARLTQPCPPSHIVEA